MSSKETIENVKPETVEETEIEEIETIEEENDKVAEIKSNEPTIEELEDIQKNKEIEKQKKIDDAKLKLEKQKNIEKKRLQDEARIKAKLELEEEQKLEKQNAKLEKSKRALIKKITQNALKNHLLVDEISLSKMDLSSLNSLYLGMVKRTLKEYKITCTNGCGFVDYTNSKEEAIKKRNNHAKQCPKKSNYGNWIILGLVLGLVSGVAVAFHSRNKKSNEDPEI